MNVRVYENSFYTSEITLNKHDITGTLNGILYVYCMATS